MSLLACTISHIPTPSRAPTDASESTPLSPEFNATLPRARVRRTMSQVSSAVANSAQYWRIAGMSYLKYANTCAEVVRASLKEPFLTQVRDRSIAQKPSHPRINVP